MNRPAHTSYDEVPYLSNPFPQSHPDRLATVATLLGLDPVPVEKCRVLELGCGMGDNLIPMAASLPESTFLGVDLSGRQIAAARQVANRLALANLELRHANIADLPRDLGRFDYIVCHGVYSWVPDDVQERILEICGDCLTEQGVAYVSYNTYPGWHMRGLVRDMMRYHAQQFTVPKVRVQQARNLLNFVAKSLSGESTPYSLWLQTEVQKVNRSADTYLLHEHLEETNEPIYFHQFIERAEQHGLKYLAEADLRAMSPGNFPPEVENVLQMLSTDIIHLEQYMDFLRNRMFRQTLLCRAAISATYTLRAERLSGMHVASQARPAAQNVDLHSNEYEKFESSDGTISLNHPLTKAAMLCLSEAWPRSVRMDDLRLAARQRLSWELQLDQKSIAEDFATLGKCLLTAYTSPSSRLVELNRSAPRFVIEISERPIAGSLPRLQALTSSRVTNMRHEIVEMDELQRQLLPLLDGARDRGAILDELRKEVERGALVVTHNLQEASRAEASSLLNAAVDEALSRLTRQALLTR